MNSLNMKKIEANNYAQAFKELEAESKQRAEEIKKEIPFSERKFYHVVLVRFQEQRGKSKNLVFSNTQTYNKKAFRKFDKNKGLFCDKAIILHDPTRLDEKDEVILPKYAEVKTESEIRAEVEKGMEEKIEKRVKKALAEQRKDFEARQNQKEGIDSDGGDSVDDTDTEVDFSNVVIDLKDINTLKLDELKEYAADYEIDISKAKNRNEAIALIREWIIAHNEKAEASKSE